MSVPANNSSMPVKEQAITSESAPGENGTYRQE